MGVESRKSITVIVIVLASVVLFALAEKTHQSDGESGSECLERQAFEVSC